MNTSKSDRDIMEVEADGSDDDEVVIINDPNPVIEIDDSDDDSNDNNQTFLSAPKILKNLYKDPIGRQDELYDNNSHKSKNYDRAPAIPIYKETVEQLCKYFGIDFKPEWSLSQIRKIFKEKTRMHKQTPELLSAIDKNRNAQGWCRGLLAVNLPEWFQIYHIIVLMRMMSNFNVNNPTYFVKAIPMRKKNAGGYEIKFLNIGDCRQVFYAMQGIQCFQNQIVVKVDFGFNYQKYKEQRSKKAINRIKLFRREQTVWCPNNGGVEMYDSDEEPGEFYTFPTIEDIQNEFKRRYGNERVPFEKEAQENLTEGSQNTKKAAIPNKNNVAVPNTNNVAVPITNNVAAPTTNNVAAQITKNMAVPNTNNVAVPVTKNVAAPIATPVSVPPTSNVAVPNTNNVAVPNTNNVAVPNTNNVAVPNTNNVAVPNTNNVAVPNTNNVAVPNTNNVTAPITKNVAVPNTKSSIVPSTKDVAISYTKNSLSKSGPHSNIKGYYDESYPEKEVDVTSRTIVMDNIPDSWSNLWIYNFIKNAAGHAIKFTYHKIIPSKYLVIFPTHEDAVKVCKELNGTQVANGKTIVAKLNSEYDIDEAGKPIKRKLVTDISTTNDQPPQKISKPECLPTASSTVAPSRPSLVQNITRTPYDNKNRNPKETEDLVMVQAAILYEDPPQFSSNNITNSEPDTQIQRDQIATIIKSLEQPSVVNQVISENSNLDKPNNCNFNKPWQSQEIDTRQKEVKDVDEQRSEVNIEIKNKEVVPIKRRRIESDPQEKQSQLPNLKEENQNMNIKKESEQPIQKGSENHNIVTKKEPNVTDCKVTSMGDTQITSSVEKSDLLLFRNLPPSVCSEALASKLGELGELLFCELTATSRAVVRFKDPRDAERCQRLFHHSRVDGRVIEVTLA